MSKIKNRTNNQHIFCSALFQVNVPFYLLWKQQNTSDAYSEPKMENFVKIVNVRFQSEYGSESKGFFMFAGGIK